VSEGSKPGESGAEIRPAPEGYHTVTPWIVSRDTVQLLDFVREAFGAEEIARVHNEDGTIGHAEFRIAERIRSRDSCIAVSGKPTMMIPGLPGPA
jgi:hypothetical protein